MGIFGGTGKFPQKSRRRWAAAVLGALALAALWWLFVCESAPAILNVDITDTRTPGSPVTHHRIPKAYLDRSMIPDAREQPLVELVAYLPDLLSEEDAKRAGYPIVREVVGRFSLPSDNRVDLTVRRSVPEGVIKDLHALIKDDHARFDGVRGGAYEVYTITKRNFSGNYLPDPSQGEYLKPIGRDDLFIACRSLNMAPENASCDIYTQFSGKLEIRFLVTRSRLAEWPSVERKVRRLVSSFVVQ